MANDTPKGSASRKLRSSGKLPFSQVKIEPGAQRSHVIPKEIYNKTVPGLFKLIAKAKLPDGQLPFDPENYRQNGQALPSDTSVANGKAVFDLSQHIGSHPQVNTLIEERLKTIETNLDIDLRGVNDPDHRNRLLVEANAKVRNLADTMAAISVGGVVDPAHREVRAVYNRADPNARILWPEWNTWTNAEKDAKIKTNLDDLLGRFVDPSTGDLTEQGKQKMKILRDLTGGEVGARLTSVEAKLANNIAAHMAQRGIDATKVDAAAYSEIHKADIVPATGELAERAEKIWAARSAAKVAAKIGVTALGAGFAALDLYDYVDTGGRVAAFARGDAQFASSFDEAFNESNHFSGVDYLPNMLSGPDQIRPLGDLPVPENIIASFQNEAQYKASLETHFNSRYALPSGLRIVITKVNYKDGKPDGGEYTVDDTSTPLVREHVQVIWRSSSSNGTGGSAILLQRAGAGDVLIVTDTATGARRAYHDPRTELHPNGELEENIYLSVSSDAVKRAKGQAALQSKERRSVAVNGSDPTSIAKAVEIIHDTQPATNVELAIPEITVSAERKNQSFVAVVVDGVVHVIRGAGEEIERFVNALAKGPGVLAEDIKNFSASGKGLIDLADVGQILGSQLSAALKIKDPWARIGASTAIGSTLTNIGQALDLVGTVGADGAKLGMSGALDSAFKDFGKDLLQAGTGAVSSYIVGNLLAELGLSGTTLDASVAFAGPTIGKIAYNALTRASWNAGLTTGFFATAAASFLGSKLADSIIKFDTVGGQIGAAVGQAVGTITAVKLFEASLATGNPYAILAAAAIIAVSQIIGGLIGSVFGGTPRSGADASWSESEQKFVVANVYSRKGGSKDAARNLAEAVTYNYNIVLETIGGKLLNPSVVQSGNYGMRKSDYVYRPYSSTDQYTITAKFNGKDGAQQLINHGTYLGLSSMIGHLAGGDAFVKRALASNLSKSSTSTFDLNAMAGDFAIAQDYGRYLLDSQSIDILISEFPDTAYAAGWITTLVRAYELGLDRRHSTDWTGGWNAFLDEMRDGSIDGSKWNVGALKFEYRDETKQRLFGFADEAGVVTAYISDTIDSRRVSKITAGAAADIIDLRSGKLANQIGYTVNGTLNDDIAVSGADFTALSSSVSFAAGAMRTSVTVTLASGDDAETSENFIASLSNAPDMRIMGGDAVATIIDGASALPTLMVSDSFAWEDDGYAVFRLSLSKAMNMTITVALTLADERAAGAGGANDNDPRDGIARVAA